MENNLFTYLKYLIIFAITLLNTHLTNYTDSKYQILTIILLIILLFIDIINSRENNKLIDISLNLLTTSFVFIGLFKNIKIVLLLLTLFILLTYYNIYKEKGKLALKIEILKSLRVLIPILIFIYHIYKTSPGPISLNFNSISSYTLIALIIIAFSIQIKRLEKF